MCDWATCNSTLHFSGTLLGSARGTWLLPVCGRNLYNCLCSFFLSLFSSIIRCTKTLNSVRLWTTSDSESGNSFSERKKEVFENTIPPPPHPSCCGFSHQIWLVHHICVSMDRAKFNERSDQQTCNSSEVCDFY